MAQALKSVEGQDPSSRVAQKVNLEWRVWSTAYELQMEHEDETVETKAQEVRRMVYRIV